MFFSTKTVTDPVNPVSSRYKTKTEETVETITWSSKSVSEKEESLIILL